MLREPPNHVDELSWYRRELMDLAYAGHPFQDIWIKAVRSDKVDVRRSTPGIPPCA